MSADIHMKNSCNLQQTVWEFGAQQVLFEINFRAKAARLLQVATMSSLLPGN